MLLVLPANFRVDWKVIARYKHYSLFDLIIRNKGKKFYNIDIRLERLGRDKHFQNEMKCCKYSPMMPWLCPYPLYGKEYVY